MMIVDSKFEIGQEVYLTTDIDQHKRMITSIQIRLGNISYEVSCGANCSWHYDFEISEEINVLIT